MSPLSGTVSLSPCSTVWHDNHSLPSSTFCSSHLNRGRLEELVAEHLDHLYYVTDILSLGVSSLNNIITDQLLNRLLIPLYVFSIADHTPFPEGVSTSLLSEVEHNSYLHTHVYTYTQTSLTLFSLRGHKTAI